MTAGSPETRRQSLRLCLWCAVAAVAEVGLYLSYRGHDARFHWFTHLFVGASVALAAMAVVVERTGRPVSYPMMWPLLAHIFAIVPDLLFIGGIAHRRWMDLFLGHVSTHFVPGRNVSWFVLFLASLAAYFVAVWRAVPTRTTGSSSLATPGAATRC